jgi:hypothetical protein
MMASTPVANAPRALANPPSPAAADLCLPKLPSAQTLLFIKYFVVVVGNLAIDHLLINDIHRVEKSPKTICLCSSHNIEDLLMCNRRSNHEGHPHLCSFHHFDDMLLDLRKCSALLDGQTLAPQAHVHCFKPVMAGLMSVLLPLSVDSE